MIGRYEAGDIRSPAALDLLNFPIAGRSSLQLDGGRSPPEPLEKAESRGIV